MSRVILSGGPAEHVVDLPYHPTTLALVDDDIYVMSHPNDNGSLVIIKVSIPTGSIVPVFARLGGGFARIPWFVAYRDRVLWADDDTLPPKLYEIRGDSVTPVPTIDPMPHYGAVMFGSLVTTEVRSIGDSPSFGLVDLESGDARIFGFQSEDGYQQHRLMRLVGVRDEFIFVTDKLADDKDDKLLRLRTSPAHDPADVNDP